MPANTLARSLRRGEVLELLTKQEIEVPAGLELRIGAGFGRNEFFQIKSAEKKHFTLIADADDLRTKVSATAETTSWITRLAGSYVPSEDIHMVSLVRLTKPAVFQNTTGQAKHIPASTFFHHGIARSLPGCVLLQALPESPKGSLLAGKEFFLLDGQPMAQHLAEGTFVHANGLDVASTDYMVDFTPMDLVVPGSLASIMLDQLAETAEGELEEEHDSFWLRWLEGME